jgi:hypothetical protein
MSPRSSRWAQGIVVATCLVTGGLLALHFVMTFLYVAPRNPISARADNAIRSYILPYLDRTGNCSPLIPEKRIHMCSFAPRSLTTRASSR